MSYVAVEGRYVCPGLQASGPYAVHTLIVSAPIAQLTALKRLSEESSGGSPSVLQFRVMYDFSREAYHLVEAFVLRKHTRTHTCTVSVSVSVSVPVPVLVPVPVPVSVSVSVNIMPVSLPLSPLVLAQRSMTTRVLSHRTHGHLRIRDREAAPLA